jgi:phospholipase C
VNKLSLAVAAATLLGSAFVGQAPAQAAATGLEGIPRFDHVVVLTEENESASTTFAPGSAAVYLNSLRSKGVFLPNYYGTGHVSLDNYIAMVSGQPLNPLTSSDCTAVSLWTCAQPQGAYASGRNLADQLEGVGLDWRSYQDGTGSPCFHGPYAAGDLTPDPYQGNSSSGAKNYADRHNPFIYFPDVIGNQARCDAHQRPYTDLASDLANNALPAFSFITPDTCHDGHDSPCADGSAGGLAGADAWLQQQLPSLLTYLANNNGLLVINFDEGSTTASSPSDVVCPTCASGGLGGRTAAVLVSPRLPQGETFTTSYDHDSLLRTVEDSFGITEHLNLAQVATPMTDAFVGTTP